MMEVVEFLRAYETLKTHGLVLPISALLNIDGAIRGRVSNEDGIGNIQKRAAEVSHTICR